MQQRPRGLQIRIKQNAKEAKVELRNRALAFAWLQLQRKRAKPGQKGKSCGVALAHKRQNLRTGQLYGHNRENFISIGKCKNKKKK